METPNIYKLLVTKKGSNEYYIKDSNVETDNNFDQGCRFMEVTKKSYLSTAFSLSYKSINVIVHFPNLNYGFGIIYDSNDLVLLKVSRTRKIIIVMEFKEMRPYYQLLYQMLLNGNFKEII